MATLIEETDLSTMAKNALLAAGYYTMDEVVVCPAWELLRAPNFGRKSLKEVEAWAASVGQVAGEERHRLQRSLEQMQQRHAILTRDMEALQTRLNF